MEKRRTRRSLLTRSAKVINNILSGIVIWILKPVPWGWENALPWLQRRQSADRKLLYRVWGWVPDLLREVRL
jgi:hypothetical protein